MWGCACRFEIRIVDTDISLVTMGAPVVEWRPEQTTRGVERLRKQAAESLIMRARGRLRWPCSGRFGGAMYYGYPSDLSWWSYHDPALGSESAIRYLFPADLRSPPPTSELNPQYFCPISNGFSQPNICPLTKSTIHQQFVV